MVREKENIAEKPVIHDTLAGAQFERENTGLSAQNPEQPRHRGRPPKNRVPEEPVKETSRKTPAPSPSLPDEEEEIHPKFTHPASDRDVRQSVGQNKIKKFPRSQLHYERDPEAASVRIIPLGGLEEIGKNMTIIEYGDEAIMIDCGQAFPNDDELFGVDVVIPDMTYIDQIKDKLRGVVITHGHEDHIGCLPFLLKDYAVPVFGTKLTIGLVNGKMREHGIPERARLFGVVAPGDVVSFGQISVEFIASNHSIPDAVALAIYTPAGVIIHTGDFKIDMSPIIGPMIDLPRIAELGKAGVLLLLSDSTNSERPGYTASERTVGQSFDGLFERAEKKRIIIATFASNIHRVQQIVDKAEAFGRKVAVSGRSMINTFSIATELGYLKIPDGLLVDIEELNNYLPEQLVLITTGSQGEPMSALSRMAFSDHRKVEVDSGDFIIISATPIPGNERMVTKIVNRLLKLGAEVIYERMYDVHVSGHACQEEQKMIISLAKPAYFMPVHGEYKHLKKHAETAETVGIARKNILLGENGAIIEAGKNGISVVGSVPAGRVYVDGLGVGDVGSVVLRDRRLLSQDGILTVAAVIDIMNPRLVVGPEITSRGFVFVKESEQLLETLRAEAVRIIEELAKRDVNDINIYRNEIKEALSKRIYFSMKRSPIVVPIIMAMSI
ncbi:MAG TPA: ribonuclease J [Oscillospiraceae bacterium]|nr:ribonuclease J [Oscillospiraceae bacterium]HPS33633.1 ribonuclease J [Oscillospiraceae bacterium]